ncbi:MAG: P-loop domain-containing protein, partial [Methanobacterium sp.]
VSEFQDKGVFVLLMTPHSVRRPDGFCLNEISRAIQRGLKVIPIMLVFTEPPLYICRIQWLDMMDCIPIDKKIKNYEKKFVSLLEALEQDKIDFEGFQSSIYNLLEPIPFDADILQHINRFSGRKWLFKSIDEWLSSSDASRILLIIGNPGSGKTAIASWLSDNCKYIEAFHLCRQGHCDKSDPRKAVTSIAYQLSTQFPEYQERLKSLNLRRLIEESNAKTLFDSLIVQPLSSNFPEPDNTVVILIDALDEATKDGKNELASFIASEFPLTPPWLRLIITTRRENDVMTPLQGLNPYIVNIEPDKNTEDIKNYIMHELKDMKNLKNEDINSISNFILDRSEGNFLYAVIICQELENGRLSINRLEEFPVGLGGIYWEFFERKFSKRANYYEEKIRPALEIISASQEPLTLKLIASILNWNEYDLRFTKFLGSFFPIKKIEEKNYEDSKIQPFHQTLIDWLTDIEKADIYFVSVNEGHKLLSEYGWQEYLTDPSKMSRYILNHLPIHLLKTEQWDNLNRILTDFKYIDVKCKASMVYNLIKDYERALNKLPEAQLEKESELKHGEKIRTYTNHIIEFAEEKIKFIPILNSFESDNEYQIENHENYIINHSSNIDILQIFNQFVNSESHGLIKFGSMPGFCLQQAYNSAKEGPIASTAEKILKDIHDEILFLQHSSQRISYNPHSALLKTLEGHKTTVRSVSITYDGKKAISGSRDKTLRLWDLKTGKCLKTLKGHTEPLYDVSMTPDGKKALSGSSDNTIRVWDLKTGECLKILKGHEERIYSVNIFPNGKKAVSGGKDKTLRLW